MEVFYFQIIAVNAKSSFTHILSCILEPNVEISAMLLVTQGNFKIQGARVTYDIYSMMLLLRDTTFRCEREEKVNIVYHQMILLLLLRTLKTISFFRNVAKWRVK